MPGPAPRENRQARPNRDIPWVDLPASGNSNPPPDYPTKIGARGKRLWDTLWSSPMSTQWSEPEHVAAERLCRLADAFHREPKPGTSAEMRQLEHSLGLTAKARKELRWRIVEDGQLLEQNGEPLVPAAELRKKLRVVG